MTPVTNKMKICRLRKDQEVKMVMFNENTVIKD
jgi:hypothetical protein